MGSPGKKKKKHRRTSTMPEESKREFSEYSMKVGLDTVSKKYSD